MRRKQIMALGLAAVMATGMMATSTLNVYAEELPAETVETTDEKEKEDKTLVAPIAILTDQTTPQTQTVPVVSESTPTGQAGTEEDSLTEEEFIKEIQDEVDELLAEADQVVLGPLMYTEESWARYEAARADLLALREDPVKYYDEMYQQILAIENAFLDAVDILELRPQYVDKTYLYSLIEETKARIAQADKYPVEYIRGLKDALASIDESKIEEMTQAQTDEATERLQFALWESFEQMGADAIKEYEADLDEIVKTGLCDENEVAKAKNLFAKLQEAVNNYDWEQIEELTVQIEKLLYEDYALLFSPAKLKTALAAKTEAQEYKALYEDIKANPQKYDENTTKFYVESYEQAAALAESEETDPIKLYDALQQVDLGKTHVKELEDSVDFFIEDMKAILEKESKIVDKEGGLKKADFEKMEALYKELEELVADPDADKAEIQEKYKELNDLYVTAVRLTAEDLKPEEKPDPKPDDDKENPKDEDKDDNKDDNKDDDKDEDKDEAPKTGDPVSLLGLGALMFTSGSVSLYTLKKKRKEEE